MNFTLCCLLITQYLQDGTFIELSLRSHFRLERIFKLCSDMCPNLKCHIIVNSSPLLVNATHTSVSRYVFPLSICRFTPIISAFTITNTPLTIFIILFSIWLLHSRSSNCSQKNKFIFRPLTYRIS